MPPPDPQKWRRVAQNSLETITDAAAKWTPRDIFEKVRKRQGREQQEQPESCGSDSTPTTPKTQKMAHVPEKWRGLPAESKKFYAPHPQVPRKERGNSEVGKIANIQA